MKTPKLSFLILLLFLAGMPMQSWGQEEMIRKYADLPGVRFVSVGGGITNAFATYKVNEYKMAGKPRKILVLDIQNTETAGKFHAELTKYLEKEEYETLVENREKGETSLIYFKESKPNKKKKIQTSLIVYNRKGEETNFVCVLGEKEE